MANFRPQIRSLIPESAVWIQVAKLSQSIPGAGHPDPGAPRPNAPVRSWTGAPASRPRIREPFGYLQPPSPEVRSLWDPCHLSPGVGPLSRWALEPPGWALWAPRAGPLDPSCWALWAPLAGPFGPCCRPFGFLWLGPSLRCGNDNVGSVLGHLGEPCDPWGIRGRLGDAQRSPKGSPEGSQGVPGAPKNN